MAVHGLIVRSLGGGTSTGTIPLLILRGLNTSGAPPAGTTRRRRLLTMKVGFSILLAMGSLLFL